MPAVAVKSAPFCATVAGPAPRTAVPHGAVFSRKAGYLLNDLGAAVALKVATCPLATAVNKAKPAEGGIRTVACASPEPSVTVVELTICPPGEAFQATGIPLTGLPFESCTCASSGSGSCAPGAPACE